MVLMVSCNLQGVDLILDNTMICLASLAGVADSRAAPLFRSALMRLEGISDLKGCK